MVEYGNVCIMNRLSVVLDSRGWLLQFWFCSGGNCFSLLCWRGYYSLWWCHLYNCPWRASPLAVEHFHQSQAKCLLWW